MDDTAAQQRIERLRTIPEFCERNLISRARYFTLKRAGKGPREIRVGLRTGITPEAEQDWRRAMEAEHGAA